VTRVPSDTVVAGAEDREEAPHPAKLVDVAEGVVVVQVLKV
jgi:hypothetical protein